MGILPKSILRVHKNDLHLSGSLQRRKMKTFIELFQLDVCFFPQRPQTSSFLYTALAKSGQIWPEISPLGFPSTRGGGVSTGQAVMTKVNIESGMEKKK